MFMHVSIFDLTQILNESSDSERILRFWTNPQILNESSDSEDLF